MPRKKKKVKAKTRKTKAKRKIVPKKSFSARAPMAGVLCIKLDKAGHPRNEACVVKRFTSDVQDAADRGEIIAIVLKGNHVATSGNQIAAKPAKFDEFMGKGKVQDKPAPAKLVEEDTTPVETYSNGHDHHHEEPVAQAASAPESF
jgi:hypothetical protein